MLPRNVLFAQDPLIQCGEQYHGLSISEATPTHEGYPFRVVTKQTDTNRRICLFDRRTIFVCLSGSPERPSLSVWFVSRIYLPKKVRDQYKVQVAEKTIDRRSISDLPQTMNADPDMPRQALLACYDGTH